MIGAGDAGGADLRAFAILSGSPYPKVVLRAASVRLPCGQVRFAAFREMMAAVNPMALRIAADKDQPSVAIEIPLKSRCPTTIWSR